VKSDLIEVSQINTNYIVMGNFYRVILQYIRIPPVETGGYSQETPTEFGNRGLFTGNTYGDFQHYRY
jgi:hypothetical protein